MTAHHLSLSFAGDGHAVLILPRSMNPEALRLLEREIIDALAEARRNQGDATGGPGEVEYASWLQYLRPARPPGSIRSPQGAC